MGGDHGNKRMLCGGEKQQEIKKDKIESSASVLLDETVNSRTE